MLPQHIIFAIFTALLTQGKIAAAIPQVDFQANEERLDGTAEYNHIAARDWTSEAKIRNTGIDVGPLTTTADDVPIVIRAPTDCDPAVSNLANGVQPRNIDDYIDWMTKLNTAITLSAQVWILLPVSVLGVGFLAIPSVSIPLPSTRLPLLTSVSRIEGPHSSHGYLISLEVSVAERNRL